MKTKTKYFNARSNDSIIYTILFKFLNEYEVDICYKGFTSHQKKNVLTTNKYEKVTKTG